MTNRLRALIIEDSENDTILIERALSSSGFSLETLRIETQSELEDALKSKSWDIILSDYMLPRFSGLDAFETLQKTGKDIPFIIISGNIGEEIAVDAMRAGVRDYVLKDNLTRLPQAVQRELEEAKARHEHKQSEELLQKTQEEMALQRLHNREMKLLGQLVSGVAHEVRNPLNAITALLDALFLEIENHEEYDQYIHHIRMQVDRLTKLMQDLLELGKPVELTESSTVDITELCTKVTEVSNHSFGVRNQVVHFVNNNKDSSMLIRGDLIRMQQVLTNLLENASQHSPDNSEIIVTLSDEGRNICIAVGDQGSGIKTENQERIFEPFFTTRKSGTGLGLGIAHHIIEAHGGTITIFNNDPGPGATAKVVLPKKEKP